MSEKSAAGSRGGFPLGASSVICITAVLLAAAAMLSGGSAERFADISAAAAAVLVTWGIQRARLKKAGLTEQAVRDNRKSIDPRLAGSLGDISGIGSTLGTLAGTSVIISELFIANGGSFGSGSGAAPVLKALAEGLCTISLISVTTSRASVCRSLFIIGGSTLGLRGEELTKKVLRSTRSETMMKRLRRMACVRVIAAIALSLTVTMAALSGVGLAYTCWQTALLCMMAVIMSESFPVISDSNSTDEKIPLFSKSSKLKCTVNVIVFLAIAFGFIFTFPFRSVYTGYVVDFVYENDVEVTTTPMISVPERNEDTACLFSGFFMVSGLMLAVAAGGYSLSEGFRSAAQIKSELIAAAITAAVTAVYGVFVGSAALDALQYLVVLSSACLAIVINMILCMAQMRTDVKKQ